MWNWECNLGHLFGTITVLLIILRYLDILVIGYKFNKYLSVCFIQEPHLDVPLLDVFDNLSVTNC